jgi:hypothetical protein
MARSNDQDVESKPASGTVRESFKVGHEKGNDRDFGEVSRSDKVTDPETMKEGPEKTRQTRTAPGADVEGAVGKAKIPQKKN